MHTYKCTRHTLAVYQHLVKLSFNKSHQLYFSTSRMIFLKRLLNPNHVEYKKIFSPSILSPFLLLFFLPPSFLLCTRHYQVNVKDTFYYLEGQYLNHWDCRSHKFGMDRDVPWEDKIVFTVRERQGKWRRRRQIIDKNECPWRVYFRQAWKV